MSVSAPAASSPSRVWMRRVLRWFVAPALALFFAAAAGLYLVCTFKSELITSALEQQLRSTTGLPWQIRGELKPKFLPYPGIIVHNVRILAASTEQELASRDFPPLVSVERLHVLLDFPALLTGSVQLHLVELEHADITFAYDKNGNPLWIPLHPAGEPEPEGALDAGPVGPGPAASTAASGTAAPKSASETAEDEQPPASGGRISPQEQTRQAVQSLNDYFARDDHEYLPKLRIRGGTFTLLDREGRVDLSLQDLDMRFRPDEPERLLEYDAAFLLPPAGLEARFSCTMALELEPAVALKGRLEGRLSMEPPGSRAATGRFGSSVLWDGGSPLISLPDFHFEAEGDSLSAELALDLVEEAYHGSVQVHTLSLPRWFKFGRNLPPGLQEPLHTLSGSMDVYGTDHMVEGRNMRFIAGGLEVLGSISCPDYAAPEVLVDLSIESANLDLVLPFLSAPGTVVPEPVEPKFSMSYLVPYPGLAEDEGPDVGYDVRIHVARPLVHQLTPGPLEVRVFPLTDQPQPTPTRITFTDNELLEGKINGWLDVTRGKVKMHYELDKVRILDLPENKGNSVTVDGRVSGVADMDIDVDADGHWANNWQMDMNAVVNNLKIMGGKGDSAWWITFGTASAKGKGPIYTVRREGMSISGNWDLALGNVHSSWHPKGKDTITGTFAGALAWLPVKPEEENNMYRRRGVERVFGDIAATGQLIVPLASERVPVKGKMSGKATWNLHTDTMDLDEMAFDGLGSFVGGSVHIDTAGKEVKIAAPVNFKLAPRVLLNAWDLLPSGGVQMPATFTGTASVSSEGTTVVFDQIKAQVDGDPIEGRITGSGGQHVPGSGSKDGEKGSHWIFRLNSSRLNLDTFFPPATPEEKKKAPSREPWNLSFLSNLSIDAELTAAKAKFHGANLVGTKIVAALQRGRFSLQVLTSDFYGGSSTLLAQGTFVPERSQMNLSRILGEMKSFSLGRALQDLTEDNSYGGNSDIIFDLSGTMQSNADLYAGLSGIWSMKITDGVYPAFVGSETAGLRNTFSHASSSGVMEKGVIKSENFQLKGMMVDMYGKGWVDLVQDVMDLELYVTLAKVPTFPVRLSGDLHSPSMTLRGAHMVVHTAQAAGSTIFGLIRGVLELPGRAVRAIGGE